MIARGRELDILNTEYDANYDTNSSELDCLMMFVDLTFVQINDLIMCFDDNTPVIICVSQFSLRSRQ